MKLFTLLTALLSPILPAATILMDKEVGVWEINGLITDTPNNQFQHVLKEGDAFNSSKQLVNSPTVNVALNPHQIIITFTNNNPLQYSNESFSGLRFYDFAASINDLEQFRMASMQDAYINHDDPTRPTTLTENDGSTFNFSRLVINDDDIFINFSGIRVPGLVVDGVSEQRVVIDFCPVSVPEPSSLFLSLSGLTLLTLRRNRCKVVRL